MAEGVTDIPEELDPWAAFVLEAASRVPVRLASYRHRGTRERARQWPETSPQAVERVRSRFAALGLGPIITL